MKIIASGLSFLTLMIFAFSVFAVTPEKPMMTLKVGDEIYACACGEKCACKTLSMNAGKCTCGVDLVKSKVVKVEKDMAMINVNGKDETFPSTGKFVCACGEKCPCNTISQNPGKCTCGKDLAPAK